MNLPTGRSLVADDKEMKNARQAKLELAEEVLDYFNRNIQLTIELLIQCTEEIEPLLNERAENSARISTLVQNIREQVESEQERELLDTASARWSSAHSYGRSVHRLIDRQKRADAGAVMANVMLPLLLDSASWRAFLQFLRAQVGAATLDKELKHDLAERASAFVRANQELKSAVAERKRIAEKLSQLASIIECSNDAIIIHTLDGTIVSWNVGAESVYGYSASEVLGQPRNILLPDDQPDELPAILEQLKLGKRIQLYETVHIRKDGQRIDVSMMISPVKDASEKVVGAAAITRDISDRKKAEERFYKAFNASPEPITIANLADGRFVDVNESFLHVTGFCREEVIGRTSLELKFWDRAEDYRELVEALEERASVRDMEITFLAKSGERRTGLNSAEVIDIVGQKCILAIFKDITERKALEAKLRQAQKMESIGRLSGGIAHDFNNLLGVIIGYGSILEERVDVDSDLRKGVQEIKKAGQRAAALTRQLLAFSRQQVLEPKVLSLNTVVADIGKMLLRLIGEDIELTTLLQSELGRVKADQGQIEQVIMNLAVNARDAMPRGGKLIIETRNVEVDENLAGQRSSTDPGRYISLAVTDTGFGMDKETQSHIFEPFFTTKEKDKGTGLGLSVVYGVVKQSGGYIWVYSELGKGTTFKIYLPRVEEAVERDNWQPPVKSLKGSETILLVEDEESLRALTRSLLVQSGYTVMETNNGARALEIARDYRGSIHLLLTDVVLPGIGGSVLAEEMATQYPAMKVLFMSGYTDNAVAAQGVLEEGTFLLQKPFEPEALRSKVREVLDAASPKNLRAPFKFSPATEKLENLLTVKKL
jgi:two-component system, cell cycle sensor histidine kinase and response regulator CckA